MQDGFAQGLYASVNNFFEENLILPKNIVGFASYNSSRMMWANAGFQARLKVDVPGVFVLGCMCHSFALCANHVSNHLPSWLEMFVKDVCCQHEFHLVQDTVQASYRIVLKFL